MKHILLFLILAQCLFCQPYVDAPMIAGADQMDALLKPYVDMALKSYPTAKQKFIKGLPKGAKFFIGTELVNPNVAKEMVFVEVRAVTENSILGVIASRPMGKVRFSAGDRIEVNDDKVTNWTIVSKDGKEEGNYVGKAIDAFESGKVGIIYKIEKIQNQVRVKCVDAVSSQQQSILDLFDARTIEQGERIMQKSADSKSSQFSEQPLYAFLVYNFRSKTFEEPNSPSR